MNTNEAFWETKASNLKIECFRLNSIFSPFDKKKFTNRIAISLSLLYIKMDYNSHRSQHFSQSVVEQNDYMSLSFERLGYISEKIRGAKTLPSRHEIGQAFFVLIDS